MFAKGSTSFSRNWKRRRRWRQDPTTFKAGFHHNPNKSLPHVISCNISITTHAQRGELDAARQLFDQMPHRTVVSWNAMISAYTRWGRAQEALNVVSVMHRSGTKLNETTFSVGLSACSRGRSLNHGKQTHCLVLKSGFEGFELVGSSLLNCYASCLEIDDARQVFDVLHMRNPLLWSLMLVGYVQCNLMKDALGVFMRMPARDVVPWTALISGFSQREDGCEKALEFFRLMRASGEAEPNEFTLDSVVRACGRLGVLSEGKMVHGLLIRYGFESDSSIGGALIELYCNCDGVEDAKSVYDRLVEPCLSTSNTLIEGLIATGRIEDAESVFNGMVELNTVSYNLMIKGYGQSGRVEDSRSLFWKMPGKTLVSSNTMIAVYCRNGEFDEAFKLFEATKGEKDTVTWNCMISGYVQNDQPEEAFKLYMNMHRLAVERNRSTFSTLFRACSGMGALQQGKSLHAHVIKTPFESNVYVGTSLVDMYAKCGSLTDAQASFNSVPSPNVAAWTALINGYAHHGLGIQVTPLFERMLEQGVEPNVITFVGLITACGRSGLVKEGMQFFHLMEKYRLMPTQEHYACIVDLLGRSGYLQEAEEFINKMPIEPDSVVLGALLSACWFFMDMEVGERVAERMFSLDSKQMSTYVLMSNIYAGVGRWEEVLKVRKKLRGMQLKKDPGCSWIEVKNTVHVFHVEDRSHPHCNEIYEILQELTAKACCSLGFDYSLYSYQINNFLSFLCRPLIHSGFSLLIGLLTLDFLSLVLELSSFPSLLAGLASLTWMMSISFFLGDTLVAGAFFFCISILFLVFFLAPAPSNVIKLIYMYVYNPFTSLLFVNEEEKGITEFGDSD